MTRRPNSVKKISNGVAFVLYCMYCCLMVRLSAISEDSSHLPVAQAINLRTHSSVRTDDDDDSDLNVDPNMAQDENQYMFGAAVSHVENNQADKEDKGADEEQNKED